MKTKQALKTIAAVCIVAMSALSFSACNGGGSGNESASDSSESQAEETLIFVKDASMVVTGYEWGPAINKVIVEFKGNIGGTINQTAFTVQTNSSERTIESIYLSDEYGNEVSSDSKYLSIEMSVGYNIGSPFTYYWNKTYWQNFNIWTEPYNLTLTVNSSDITVGGTVVENGATDTVDMSANRILPDIDGIWQTGSYTYEGYAASTGSNETITLTSASYTPDGAEDDGVKNALIIWLHGAGEGGTDPAIALLGSEATALAKDEIQSYFKGDGSAGAYVLAAQTETYWMYGHEASQNADGSYTVTDSLYTEALQATIENFVNEHPDIDTDRIIIGGCSNGGYMTMNMMLHYGDYYAAYFPVCEYYGDAYISDEQIEQIKDYNIWFIHSEEDTTVDPSAHTVPTYKRLIDAGAENVHFTFTGEVVGTDDPDTTYQGHFSWVYLFNNQITYEFDNAAVKATEGNDYITHANCSVTGVNIFSWMAGINAGG